jgi:Protein of unknown function (DUF2795)
VTEGPQEPGQGRSRVSAGALLGWLTSDAFPADRDLLVAAARRGRAPAWLTGALRRLPAGRVFQDAEQLAPAVRTQSSVRIQLR